MLERLRSSKSLFRDAYHHARKRPRVTLGAAAGTAAAVIGVTAGVAAAASPAHGTAGAPVPAVHAAPIVAGSHAATPAIRQSGPASAGHSVAHSSAVTQPQQHTAAPARQPAPVQAAASKAAPARHATAQRDRQPTPARHAGRQARRGAQFPAWRGRHAAKRAWPFLIYDSVTPTAIPGKHVIATYATGSYAASAADVAGHKAVLWIDTRGSDPAAGALDVEPGDATPSMAASWAWQRLHAHPHGTAIIYTMRSEWAAAEASVGTLPRWMQHHVRWWIADPTGYPHLVPGSNATQWYWGSNYDITTAAPGF